MSLNSKVTAHLVGRKRIENRKVPGCFLVVFPDMLHPLPCRFTSGSRHFHRETVIGLQIAIDVGLGEPMARHENVDPVTLGETPLHGGDLDVIQSLFWVQSGHLAL